MTDKSATKQALFVTRNEEQLCGVDLALQELSCLPQVVASVSDALNLQLEHFFAIVLDESVVARSLFNVLDQFLSRAPQASLLVACDANSRNTVRDTLATGTAEWRNNAPL